MQICCIGQVPIYYKTYCVKVSAQLKILDKYFLKEGLDMSEKLNIRKDNGENEQIKDILYTVNCKKHNLDILLQLIKELKNDYPEVKDEFIHVYKSQFTKDTMGVEYIQYKNKKKSGYSVSNTISNHIHKMYNIEDDHVWFEYFITIEGSLNYANHLLELANEIHKDFPDVKNEDIQIKRSTFMVPIPRDFYLRFTVPKKDLNLKKLGKNVVSEDYVFYRINSTL